MVTIVFSTAPFGTPGAENFYNRGALTPQPDGRVTVTWERSGDQTHPGNPVAARQPDGEIPGGLVLSVQPDGSFDTRPAGTAGPYEVFNFDGSGLVVIPNWWWSGDQAGTPVFPQAPQIPFVIAARVVHP